MEVRRTGAFPCQWLDDLGKTFLPGLLLAAALLQTSWAHAQMPDAEQEAVPEAYVMPSRMSLDEAVWGVWYVFGVSIGGLALFLVLYFYFYECEPTFRDRSKKDQSEETDSLPPPTSGWD